MMTETTQPENPSDLTISEEEQNRVRQLIPTADEMLERLYAVDIEAFDLKTVTLEMMGNKAWLFVSVLPISAILLALLTSILYYFSDSFIISFLLSAMAVYIFGLIMGYYERHYRQIAFAEIMRRIAETEGDFGLLIHFKDFLPPKYRYLIKCLKEGVYTYVKHYQNALLLLQTKLDPEKFTRIWYLKYPDIAPKGYFDQAEKEK
ncbi:hypothetical protein [Galenea microaerophila]